MMRVGSGRVWLWTAGALAIAGGIGMALPSFTGVLAVLGRNIPQEQIERDYLVALIWATVIGATIRFWPIRPADRLPLLWIWAAKVFVALILMLPYEWNYELDAYGYFERSRWPEFPPPASSFEAGTVFIYRLTWLQGKVLPDSYHAMKITFALVGMIAVYLIYRGAVRFRGVDDRRILYWIALFPSVLFWSSIIGKDPIQLLGIGLYVYGVLSWRVTGRPRHVVWVISGITLAFFVRSWSALILLFPLLVFTVTGIRRVWLRVGFGLLAGAAFVWSLTLFARTFRIENLEGVRTAAEARAAGWEGGSAQRRTSSFSSLRDVVLFAPTGAFTALFRPLPGEVRNPFGVLAGLESAFLLMLLGVAVVRGRIAHLRDPALAWAVVLILTWSTSYGFVSYYNFGAAVRFKLQILPVLLLVLLYLGSGGRSHAVGAGAVGIAVQDPPSPHPGVQPSSH